MGDMEVEYEGPRADYNISGEVNKPPGTTIQVFVSGVKVLEKTVQASVEGHNVVSADIGYRITAKLNFE